jgi:DNA polymerase III sliding clamp (beta) subunit (PCNA family)
VFARLVERVGFATARRPVGSAGWAVEAIFLSVKSGELVAHATDAYRMAVSRVPVEFAAKKSVTFLVHGDTLREWAKAVEGDMVKLALGTRLHFECGSLAAWAAPHAGEFPTADVVSDSPPHSVTLPTETLRDAVASALALVTSRDDESKITLAVKRNGVMVSAVAGRAKADCTVPGVGAANGPAVAIAIDGARLLSTLRAYADSPTVTIGYTDDTQPIAVSALDGQCVSVQVPHRERPEPQKRARATA